MSKEEEIEVKESSIVDLKGRVLDNKLFSKPVMVKRSIQVEDRELNILDLEPVHSKSFDNKFEGKAINFARRARQKKSLFEIVGRNDFQDSF